MIVHLWWRSVAGGMEEGEASVVASRAGAEGGGVMGAAGIVSQMSKRLALLCPIGMAYTFPPHVQAEEKAFLFRVRFFKSFALAEVRSSWMVNPVFLRDRRALMTRSLNSLSWKRTMTGGVFREEGAEAVEVGGLDVASVRTGRGCAASMSFLVITIGEPCLFVSFCDRKSETACLGSSVLLSFRPWILICDLRLYCSRRLFSAWALSSFS